MMKDKKMDEYRKVFNEGGAVESSAEDMNVADNKTTEAAPEGIAETPAVAEVPERDPTCECFESSSPAPKKRRRKT